MTAPVTLGYSIRQANRDLLAGVEKLRSVADAIGTARLDVSMRDSCGALEFLRGRLIPHARIEDRHLYPAVGRALGCIEATRTMTLDHFEIAILTAKLGQAIEREDPVAMRRLLYGLYHLVRLHLAKEEDLYLPVLETRLGPEAQNDLLTVLLEDEEQVAATASSEA